MRKLLCTALASMMLAMLLTVPATATAVPQLPINTEKSFSIKLEGVCILGSENNILLASAANDIIYMQVENTGTVYVNPTNSDVADS